MKLLTAQQIRDWDKYTLDTRNITSIDLMEKAAQACVHQLVSDVELTQNVHVFCGPGNNGGDGLAIARLLSTQYHWQGSICVYTLNIGVRLSADHSVNLAKLNMNSSVKLISLSAVEDFPVVCKNDIIIDALFGSGLNKPLEGLVRDIVLYLNTCEALKIAIDIPSGLFADFVQLSEVVFMAHKTYTFQVPKLSFLLPDTGTFCGELNVLDIGLDETFLSSVKSPYHYFTLTNAQGILKKRAKFSHKGTYGHLLSVGGSYGKIGASILMNKSALRSGCGKLTAYIPKIGYNPLQSALPECMVITDNEHDFIHHFPAAQNYNAVVVCPGMGEDVQTQLAFHSWLKDTQIPMVLDADALNACSKYLAEFDDFYFPKNAVLTPHVKEFDRLAGTSQSSLERFEKLIAFSKKYQVVVVLKGAHTAIANPNGEVYFNSTGNAAMATAGSGDVLSGIIGSLLAQGYSTYEAAVLGVFMHGRASDIAACGKATILAGDIAEKLPEALFI